MNEFVNKLISLPTTTTTTTTTLTMQSCRYDASFYVTDLFPVGSAVAAAAAVICCPASAYSRDADAAHPGVGFSSSTDAAAFIRRQHVAWTLRKRSGVARIWCEWVS